MDFACLSYLVHTEEHQVGFLRPKGIVPRGGQDFGGGSCERHGSRRAVLGLSQSQHSPVEIYLVHTKRNDLAQSHAGVRCDAHEPTEHGVRVFIALGQQNYGLRLR
jgi:hypothetical protein